MSTEQFAWIGVDLDGTLAHYDYWRGPDHIGAPIMPMVWRVRRWLTEGRRVKVFTARACGRFDEVTLVEDWTERHIGTRLEVTCMKDFGMTELWDDRAVQVIKNTGEYVGPDREPTWSSHAVETP